MKIINRTPYTCELFLKKASAIEAYALAPSETEATIGAIVEAAEGKAQYRRARHDQGGRETGRTRDRRHRRTGDRRRVEGDRRDLDGAFKRSLRNADRRGV
ncbi:MAG: hypothetical protein LBC09_00075 [Helicobacteraceae bacterium]|nr:hypothetical protein [Helicobacteraceae bacterium]